MKTRSWSNCLSWLAVSAASIGISIYYEIVGTQAEASLALWLMALYALQGFFAEIIGVSADETGLSFPRGIYPHLRFLVFWRKQIPANDITRVDSLGDKAIRVYLSSTETVDIGFADRNMKARFLSFARKAYPERAWFRNAKVETIPMEGRVQRNSKSS